MRDMQAPWLARWVGARWLPGLVSVVVVAILAAILLQKLDEVGEDAERLLLDMTVRNMRTGLQLAIGDAIIHGREGELVTWVGRDPTIWLGQAPAGHLGDCHGGPASLAGGKWCFDGATRILWYRPRHHGLVTDGARVAGVLGWRVGASAPVGAGSKIEGLRVESVTLGP